MQTTEIKLNQVLCGKSEEKLKEFPDNFFDGIITDPPYGMGFMNKAWDTFNSQMIKEKKKEYDATPLRNIQRMAIDGHIRNINKPIGSIATVAGSYDLSISAQRHFQSYFYKIAVEMLRVSKPGSFAFVFGGTRTYHRVTCALEDAGWIIRDSIDWIYGEGFPKSTNISKQLDKEAGKEREVVGREIHQDIRGGNWNNSEAKNKERRFVNIAVPTTNDAKQWNGYGTGLKPAHEPIIVAMKPLEKGLTYAQNAKKWNVAGLNIDGGRIGMSQKDFDNNMSKISKEFKGVKPFGGIEGSGSALIPNSQGRWPSNVILSHSPDCVCVGTKQIGKGEYKKHTVEEAKASWKNSSKDINTTVYGQETAEVWACVPDCPIRVMDSQSGVLHSGKIEKHHIFKQENTFQRSGETTGLESYGDSGGASRFFYCAKAKRSEKEAGLKGFVECAKCGKFNSDYHWIEVDGKKKKEKCCRNSHPTVKPLNLMRYLINLIKMPSTKENKQVILDPFCGSGTTLVAAEQLDINYIGIDQDSDSCLISIGRIGV